MNVVNDKSHDFYLNQYNFLLCRNDRLKDPLFAEAFNASSKLKAQVSEDPRKTGYLVEILKLEGPQDTNLLSHLISRVKSWSLFQPSQSESPLSEEDKQALITSLKTVIVAHEVLYASKELKAQFEEHEKLKDDFLENLLQECLSRFGTAPSAENLKVVQSQLQNGLEYLKNYLKGYGRPCEFDSRVKNYVIQELPVRVVDYMNRVAPFGLLDPKDN